MAHNIDVNEGQASFVSAHTDAWHQLGTTLDHTFTAEEAMRVGLLGGWNVRKSPLYTRVEVDGKSQRVVIPGRDAVIRDNPVTSKIDVLGDVGSSYRIIQNEEHAGLLNALVDESGAHFETAGALNGGRQVFITMKLPGHINVGGVDPVENYLAAINSHDGGMAFTLMVTPVRVVCANTLNMAFSNKSHVFRIRHTSGVQTALQRQAREALDMTFNFLEGFQEEAEKLINTTMTQARFEEIIAGEFGPEEGASKTTVTRSEAKVHEICRLFADGQTQDGIRDTAWAGLNAITEWADHFSPTRGDSPDLSRSQKSILDPYIKDRALALMLKSI